MSTVLTRIKNKIVNHARLKSPWIMHLDCGGCNGCTIEIAACLTPRFDVERFGIVDVGNPRHADILVIDGAIPAKILPRAKRVWDQIPEPKAMVAVGTCMMSKGVFGGTYGAVGPVTKIAQPDVYVPGCPPKPEAIIDGIVKAMGVWKKKMEREQNRDTKKRVVKRIPKKAKKAKR